MIKGYCVEILIIVNSEQPARLKKFIFSLTLKGQGGPIWSAHPGVLVAASNGARSNGFKIWHTWVVVVTPVGVTLLMKVYCLWLLVIEIFVSCPAWKEALGNSMQYPHASQWDILLPNVVSILKIGAEEEGVPSSRRGAMPGNSCNQSKKFVCPNKMNYNVSLWNLHWMSNFDCL